METPKEDEQLAITNGRWRNAVAIFDRKTKKFNVSLFPFKMLIFILKTCPFAVPLGFMYKHHHGFFVPVGAAAATLMTFKPIFSNLVKGIDPVDREKGHFLGTVSAAVVAMAYIQLHQWKWQPGIQGLRSTTVRLHGRGQRAPQLRRVDYWWRVAAKPARRLRTLGAAAVSEGPRREVPW